MQMGQVSSPFGRRPMTLALVRTQLEVAETKPNAKVEKWKVLRDVCEASDRFGLQDRSLTVLDALLTFFPDNYLSEENGLVVFPSNAQLSVRAKGIKGTTLRRHLAALVDAGLIQRRDSPNGKRYAHRSRDGEIEQAFGFDLRPLLARASEIAQVAQDVAAERIRFKRAKEALTICRRDVRKLISAAIEEGAGGDWKTIELMLSSILDRLPRYPSRMEVEAILYELTLLREEVVNRLDLQPITKNMDGNDIQNGCHIQNSNPESINELEPCSREKQGEKLVDEPPAESMPTAGKKAEPIPLKSFPLGIVLRACPQISDYGPPSGISHWRELMTAAVTVRSMLGVSPSAYEEACNAMGPENAAVATACILERANFITSPGGYLRDLTRRAERGEFSLWPMLMAQLRANGEALGKVG